MINWTQPDFFDGRITPAEIEKLRAHLDRYGWQTRKQLSAVLGWSDRKVREVAEQLGAEVVRGHTGFHLTATLTTADMEHAYQAAHAALSQSRKMAHYGETLRYRLDLLKPAELPSTP